MSRLPKQEMSMKVHILLNCLCIGISSIGVWFSAAGFLYDFFGYELTLWNTIKIHVGLFCSARFLLFCFKGL